MFAHSLISQKSRGKKLWAFMVSHGDSRVNKLVDLFDKETLKIAVGDKFPLERAPYAVKKSKNGHATGKIVIRVTL